MKISLNMILDYLEKYQFENYIENVEDLSFGRLAMLTKDSVDFSSKYLYVGKLSLAEPVIKKHKIFCICVNDEPEECDFESIRSQIVMINGKAKEISIYFELQNYFYRMQEWEQQMQECIINDNSVQDFIDLAEPIIGNTLHVTDSAFSLMATTRNIDTDDEISIRLRDRRAHEDQYIEIFKERRLYESATSKRPIISSPDSDMEKYHSVNRLMSFSNSYFNHIIMVCDHVPLSEGLVDTFDIFTKYLTRLVEKKWTERQRVGQSYEAFLINLINGKFATKEEIDENIKTTGLAIKGDYVVMKLHIAEHIELYVSKITKELSDIIVNAKIFAYDKHVVILQRLQMIEDEEMKDIYKNFAEVLEKYNAIAGISDCISDIYSVGDAYNQASLVLKYNPVSMNGIDYIEGRDASQRVFPYKEYMAYCMLGEVPDGEKMWRKSEGAIALQKLYDYDMKHRSNNLKLLSTYLAAERSASATGELMSMHRNNVLYRIGRITELVGIDLNNDRVRLNLAIAYIMFSIYGPEK